MLIASFIKSLLIPQEAFLYHTTDRLESIPETDIKKICF